MEDIFVEALGKRTVTTTTEDKQIMISPVATHILRSVISGFRTGFLPFQGKSREDEAEFHTILEFGAWAKAADNQPAYLLGIWSIWKEEMLVDQSQ